MFGTLTHSPPIHPSIDHLGPPHSHYHTPSTPSVPPLREFRTNKWRPSPNKIVVDCFSWSSDWRHSPQSFFSRFFPAFPLDNAGVGRVLSICCRRCFPPDSRPFCPDQNTTLA